MSDTREMLADYVKNGSETAFRNLVARYTDLVHSTALRLVDGDAHLAQDVAQTVFVDLARKAGTLSEEVTLGGWLHRYTCFVAQTTKRGLKRRQWRERQAVAMNTPQDHTAANLAQVAPILDDAINQLDPEDRAAILLRFFEQFDFRSVGDTIGTSEDAARMRVNRAVEKLHALLKNRGVSLSAAALGTVLAAEAVTAAPAGLAATFAGTALASVTAGGVATTFMNLITMTKLKIALIGAMAVAVLATPAIIQHQSVSKLRDENRAMRLQMDQLASIQSDNSRLSNDVERLRATASERDNQTRELARLRGEVGLLRDKTNQIAKDLAAGRRPGRQGLDSSFIGGKRVFRGVTLSQFAIFISEVLEAPVADQTGLTGKYDIAMTPPRIGPADQIVQRTTAILHGDLGLQLSPFNGPFSEEQKSAVPQFAGSSTNGGYALRIDHSDAPGFKTASEEENPFGDFVAAQNESEANAAEALDLSGLPSPVANNLRLIDSSKQQWALEQRRQSSDTPTWDDIRPYLGRGPDGDISQFTNAAGGSYIIGSVGQAPRFKSSETGSSFDQSLGVAGGGSATLQAGSLTNPRQQCINNLRRIDGAKQQWALEARKQLSDTPSWDDLKPFLPGGADAEVPKCPLGGAYTIGSVGEKPKCSNDGHELP